MHDSYLPDKYAEFYRSLPDEDVVTTGDCNLPPDIQTFPDAPPQSVAAVGRQLGFLKLIPTYEHSDHFETFLNSFCSLATTFALSARQCQLALTQYVAGDLHGIVTRMFRNPSYDILTEPPFVPN